MRLGVLCSGGKDSLFACWKAMQKEDVVCLITVRSGNPWSYMFHTPNIHLVGLQAEASGLPLVGVETRGEKEDELGDLAKALRIARDEYELEGVVTGAVLSVYQASRIQVICNDLDLWCFNPLWHTDQDTYMDALVSSGFRVIISGVFSEPFDERWLGREIDPAAIRELKQARERWKITLTGEGGEYETSVLDAPFFHKKIIINKAEKHYSNCTGVFSITDAGLVDK